MQLRSVIAFPIGYNTKAGGIKIRPLSRTSKTLLLAQYITTEYWLSTKLFNYKVLEKKLVN
jgi:hypothetical protein